MKPLNIASANILANKSYSRFKNVEIYKGSSFVYKVNRSKNRFVYTMNCLPSFKK